jgi:hypothetical protein
MMEFIQYCDETTGKEFVIPELEMLEDEETSDFLNRERDAINRAIAVAVTLMSELGLDIVPTFAVANIDVVFSLNRDDSHYSIDQCITYFAEIEDYEKCANLLNLKSRI